jgi:hypothetical protein
VVLNALANAWSAEGAPKNQLARMAREYGYSGLAGEASNGQSAAALFDPVDVRRLAVKPGHRGYAQGGGVN